MNILKRGMEFQKSGKVEMNSSSEQLNVSTSNKATGQKWRKSKNTGLSIFIAKTYEILENNQYSSIISWNQQGTNFTIKDVQQFEAEILPIYFRHRNFSSFVRQLNMYDFHKIRNEKNLTMFEHKEFRRNSKDSLSKIKRKGCTQRKQDGQNDQNEEVVEEKIQISKVPESRGQRSHGHAIREKENYHFNDIKRRNNKEKYQQMPLPIFSSKGSKSRRHEPRTVREYELVQKTENENLSSARSRHAADEQNIIQSTSMENIYDKKSVSKPTTPEHPSKKELLEEFISTLPEILHSQQQIQDRIKELKINPKYKCLNSKEELRRIYQRLKNRRVSRPRDHQLEQLSIEQEIMVGNMDLAGKEDCHGHCQGNGNHGSQDHFHGVHMPMLAVVSTERFLPKSSVSLIGSLANLNYGEEIEALLYRHNL